MTQPAADLAETRLALSAARSAAAGFMERSLALFAEWRLRMRSRRELTLLGEYELRDIGLSPTQAAFESGKSFLER